MSSGEIGKQSSFESTDSSVIIPMGEEPERRASENSTSSKLFSFRKSPLQVFSKEFGNAPVRILARSILFQSRSNDPSLIDR